MRAGTRAVVVDDSPFMRTLITSVLEDDGIEVVEEASDGAAAVEAVGRRRPDVVTMDIEMPEMDGIEAVERIMAERPTPVLMLSAHADEKADVTFEALEKGAVDFVTKPGGEVTSSIEGVRDELVRKVREAAAVDLAADRAATAAARRATATPATAATAGAGAGATYADRPTLMIGASTGGPNVVEGVLGALPPAADLRVLIVQHMPEGFTERFAERLDAASAYDVREARDGDRIRGGEALVAPGGYHMLVEADRDGELRVGLSSEPPVHGVRPAVDRTMISAADAVEGPLVGALLTGMGRDGVEGMERIHEADGHTLAQDESSSAVFGMPKRAIEAGCVDAIEPADGIADGIVEAITE